MKYIIGRKLGMVQVFDVNGKLLPATIVRCEPNKVISKKDNTITVGYQEVEEKKLNKPQKGHFKKLGVKPYKVIAEFANAETNLKKIRKKSGLSQSQLAIVTDIPVRTIQQYEQRQKDINKARAEYLIKFAKALYCDPEDLIEKIE